MQKIKAQIRDIPDFPEPGILFKDLTPVIGDPTSLRRITTQLAEPFERSGVTAVAGMEARGFIFGSLVAQQLDVGFIPLRKPGKLPADTYSVSYELEYGATSLEMHTDAVTPTDRILLIDDVLATGGTAAASCALVRKGGAEIVACAFVIELDFLDGRKLIDEYSIHSLIHF
jgi:adenine phosphoribosyltransferase